MQQKVVVLGAGQDCPLEGSDEKGPCIMPVVVYQPGPEGEPNTGQLLISDRVFASASPDAPQPSIFDLSPFKQK